MILLSVPLKRYERIIIFLFF